MTATPIAETSIDSLGLAWIRLLRRFFPLIALLAATAALILLLNHPDRLMVYLAAVVPLVLILALETQRRVPALPIFPFYVLLQSLSFVSPLFAPEITADRRVLITPALLNSCAPPLLLWLGALWLGWRFLPAGLGGLRQAQPLTVALRNPGFLPHWALALAAGLQLALLSPYYWQLPGTLSAGLLTPIRTLSSLAAMFATFTGVYAWVQGQLPRKTIWLLLFSIPLFIALRSLLLSSLQGIIFAALLALWLGRSRSALPLTLVGLLLISFLNAGKASMRDLYWEQGRELPANPVVLLQEWTAASLADLRQPDEESSANLFTDRFNNLQNLLYVQQQLRSGVSPLGGDSIAVIPRVLVPRIFNPDKVRSQEGQVILNLHFGRQSSVADTRTTYIAWGFLAEGVGNFGSTLGPLLMGVGTGALLRLSENAGRHQLILSAPGLFSLVMFVFWLTTYEMAASTFAAAALQILVLVSFLGWWFGRGRPRQRLA